MVQLNYLLFLDEILFLINEVEATLSDKSENVTSKIPLDEGGFVLVTYLGNELSSSDYEITRGKENLK